MTPILVEYLSRAYLGAAKGGYILLHKWFPNEEEPVYPATPRKAFSRSIVVHGLTMVRVLICSIYSTRN